MATINELQAKFEGLTLAQKKQFIERLKTQLQNSTNVANKQFLNECIKKYNEEVQGKVSSTASKTTTQVSEASKETVGKVASQISTVGKEATSKLTPMAAAARDAGKNAFNKAAGSSLVDKVAHNETVSKIVDSEVMSKVSKNKNKRVLAIVGALAVVVLVIIVGSISRGGGGSNLNGTWVWRGSISGVPETSTIAFEFRGNRFTQTTSHPSALINTFVERGTFSISGNSITFTLDNGIAGRPQSFLRSGKTITIGSRQYTQS